MVEQAACQKSWWETDFASKLPQEQARMKAEKLPDPVQGYFDQALREEERANLCRVTHSRTPSVWITGAPTRSIDVTKGDGE